MKKPNPFIIFSSIVSLIVLIGYINNVIQFITYTKGLNIFDICSQIAPLLAVIAIFYYAIIIYKWDVFFKDNNVDLKNYQSLSKKYSSLMRDTINLDIKYDDILFRSQINSIILSNIMQTNSSLVKAKVANELLACFENNKINTDDLKQYNIPQEIISEIELIIEKNKKPKKKFTPNFKTNSNETKLL
jgi:hypothetical protein